MMKNCWKEINVRTTTQGNTVIVFHVLNPVTPYILYTSQCISILTVNSCYIYSVCEYEVSLHNYNDHNTICTIIDMRENRSLDHYMYHNLTAFRW